MPLRFALAALTVLALALLPATAGAATRCVNNDAACPPGGIDHDMSLQGALAASAINTDADTVLVGPGTYSDPGGYLYNGSGPIEIVGSGVNATVIAPPDVTGNSDVIALSLPNAPAGSSVANLAVETPGKAPSTPDRTINVIGVFGNVDLNGVLITRSDGPLPNEITGAAIAGTVRFGAVDVGTTSSNALVARAGGSGVNVEDSSLTGYNGFRTLGPPGTLRRTQVIAFREGILAGGATVTADSVLVQTTHAAGYGAVADATVNGDASLTLRNVTVTGLGNSSVQATGDEGNTANVVVDSSVVTRTESGSAFTRLTENGEANLTVRYSNYTGDVANLDLGGGSGSADTSTGNTHHADPGFETAGSFRPSRTSPLRDAGNPAAFSQSSATDWFGLARITDGNGDGAARRDMGAVEYQPQPPVPSASASPTSPLVGQNVTFTGSATDPESGDVLTYAWSFDDGDSATGESVQHAFATAGQHTATLTVTDQAGSRGTATVTVTVSAPSTTPADRDGDGVPDSTDACPDSANATANGCAAGAGPGTDDRDGDGVPNASDGCPDQAASTANGCAPNTIPGATDGNDALTGTDAAETLCGLLGNDSIDGRGGDDTLFGDACNLTARIGAAQAALGGDDTLLGGSGNDTLYGAAGKDSLDGGDGADKLFGGRGNDSLKGAAGNDSLDGGADKDSLDGGAGNDKLRGRAGNDKLTGGTGNDSLTGDAGKNSYKAGAGRDSVNARNGVRETVDCGSGKDTATVDRRDVVRGCEKVKRAKK